MPKIIIDAKMQKRQNEITIHQMRMSICFTGKGLMRERHVHKDMIVRKIRPEELKRTYELFSIAFEFSADSEKSPTEIYEEVLKHPNSREDTFWGERWAAFEDDDRTMMSYFIAQPFPMQFDGHEYTMTGIGGVATLPQYRRKGGIRGCFEAGKR